MPASSHCACRRCCEPSGARAAMPAAQAQRSKTKPPAASAAGGSTQHRMDAVQISPVSCDVKQEFLRAGLFGENESTFNTYTDEQGDAGHAALFCALMPKRSRSSAALRFSKA